MYVNFALKNKLQIYVDWVDPIWSHNGESFYTYFDLVNIPKLKSIDDIPADATVYPAFWKDKLKLPYKAEFFTTNPETKLGYILNQDYKADVVVCASDGLRYFYEGSSCNFFGDVFRVIDQRIIQKVRERQQKHDLKNKVGVHLRGTDRANRIDKSKRMAGINIRMVASGLLHGVKFVAVSDDPAFIELWKTRNKSFPVLTELGSLGGSEGVHKKPKDAITVSKDLLNVDLLVDFFTLASCRSVISTMKDSRFANESQRLRNQLKKIGL
jgi:hypothetical protein